MDRQLIRWSASPAFEVQFQPLTNDNEPEFAVTYREADDFVLILISQSVGVAIATRIKALCAVTDISCLVDTCWFCF